MTQGALGRLSLVGLAFIVILYGAYVRLTDAGLGCPDWPGCYGKLVVSDLNSPNFNFAPIDCLSRNGPSIFSGPSWFWYFSPV